MLKQLLTEAVCKYLTDTSKSCWMFHPSNIKKSFWHMAMPILCYSHSSANLPINGGTSRIICFLKMLYWQISARISLQTQNQILLLNWKRIFHKCLSPCFTLSFYDELVKEENRQKLCGLKYFVIFCFLLKAVSSDITKPANVLGKHICNWPHWKITKTKQKMLDGPNL